MLYVWFLVCVRKKATSRSNGAAAIERENWVSVCESKEKLGDFSLAV